MNTQKKLFEQEARAAAARSENPAALEGQVQMQVPPIPLFLGDIQIRPDSMNIGMSPDGKRVVQFVQGPTTVTILLEEIARKGLIKGLTGIEIAG